MNPDPTPTRPAPAGPAALNFELLVFDWDGTLFDSTTLIVQCIQSACRDIGVEVPSASAAAYVIGLGLHDALKHAAPNLAPERYPEMSDRFRHHYWARKDELVLFPGTLSMLKALKARGHKLAVATGKNRKGLNDALAHSQLETLFDATRTADETAGKPDPLMLNQLMRLFGVEPERTLMVGDTTHDLLMAVNAGTASVAVSYGAHERDNFAAHRPRFVAHAMHDLCDWLLEHG
ncbi:MAG: HAD-IA family hydrolase [Rubrivivax sp.]